MPQIKKKSSEPFHAFSYKNRCITQPAASVNKALNIALRYLTGGRDCCCKRRLKTAETQQKNSHIDQ